MNNAEKSYKAGKEEYRKLDKVPKLMNSFGMFRSSFIVVFGILKGKKSVLEKNIKEVAETYSAKVAAQKIAELREGYNLEVKEQQEMLSKQLEKTVLAKEEICRKYTLTPPTERQFVLLQALKMRDAKAIPEAEWTMYAHEFGGNYQAMAILRDISVGAGKPIKMPFSPEESLEDLHLFQGRCQNAIEKITDFENNYNVQELLHSDVEDSFASKTIKLLDTQIATTIEDTDFTTVAGRLKLARSKAIDAGDTELTKEIHTFLTNNINLLESVETRQTRLLDRAENLIHKGLTARPKQ